MKRGRIGDESIYPCGLYVRLTETFAVKEVSLQTTYVIVSL